MRPNPHAARTHTHTGKHGFDECSFQMHISECTYTYTTFFTTTSQSWRKILVNFCLGYHWWGFTVLVYTFTPLPWFNTLITFKDGGKHARLQDHVPVQTVCWPSRFCMGWGQVALSKSLRNHCKTTQNGKFKRCPSLKKTKICAGPFWQTFLTFCISNIVQHNKYCTFNSVYTKRHNGWKNETLKLRFAKSLFSPNAQAQKLKDHITPHVKPPDC